MSNLSETGTAAFDFFVSKVKDPADRCKIETLLLDVERESFELGMEEGESAAGDHEGDYDEGYQAGHYEGDYAEGYQAGHDEGYAEGQEEIGGS